MGRVIEPLEYDPAWTLREARARYFAANGFPADGGYADKWVRVMLGPVPLVFPNVPSRVRAVRLHDLHHIATGYRTDNPGEFEIGAYEVASGCRDYWAAWLLNLSSLAAGLYRCPIRTFRAFVRGRHQRNLYGRDPESLVDLTVADLRRELGTDAPAPAARGRDLASFAAYTALAHALSLVWFVPLGLVLALAWATLR